MMEVFPDIRTDAEILRDAELRFRDLRLVGDGAVDECANPSSQMDETDIEHGVQFILDRVAEAQGITLNR